MNPFLCVALIVTAYISGCVTMALAGPSINREIGVIEHKGKLYFDATVHKVEAFGRAAKAESQQVLAKAEHAVGIGKAAGAAPVQPPDPPTAA